MIFFPYMPEVFLESAMGICGAHELIEQLRGFCQIIDIQFDFFFDLCEFLGQHTVIFDLISYRLFRYIFFDFVSILVKIKRSPLKTIK